MRPWPACTRRTLRGMATNVEAGHSPCSTRRRNAQRAPRRRRDATPSPRPARRPARSVASRSAFGLRPRRRPIETLGQLRQAELDQPASLERRVLAARIEPQPVQTPLPQVDDHLGTAPLAVGRQLIVPVGATLRSTPGTTRCDDRRLARPQPGEPKPVRSAPLPDRPPPLLRSPPRDSAHQRPVGMGLARARQPSVSGSAATGTASSPCRSE